MSTTFTNEGHTERILQKMWKRCQNEEFCDVVLVAGIEEKRIPAHLSVLSEASEYFNEMLTSQREGTSKEVKISEVNGDVLQRLVEYCYKGSIVISEEIVVELLRTAKKLLFLDFVTACEKFLVEQLHPSNCLGLMFLAERCDYELLQQKAKEYSLENFMGISFSTDQFPLLSVEQLSQLLSSDDLCVRTEEDVFHSLKAWLEHDPIEREQHKVELLKLVRLPLLEESFLIEQIKPICASVECLGIFMDDLDLNAMSNSNMPGVRNLPKPRKLYPHWMGISLNRPNNKMFIHYYCPLRHKWMKCLKELEYRCKFGRVFMNNCLYILGGNDTKGKILNTVICLSLQTMTLTEISPMLEPRRSFHAVELNGFLYAMAGYSGRNYLSSVEKWHPETNEWSEVACMPVNRSNFGFAVLNKKLYSVGGYCNGKVSNSAECYDPARNKWQSIAPMGERRDCPGVAVAKGLLYALGGVGLKTAERYDPQTDKWTSITSLREKLYYSASCTTINDKVVVNCCNDSSYNCFEEYDAVSNKWKKIAPFKYIDHMYSILSYPGKLLTSIFVEM